MNGSQPPNGYSPSPGQNYGDPQLNSSGYEYSESQDIDWDSIINPPGESTSSTISGIDSSLTGTTTSVGQLSKNSAPVLNLVPSLILAVVSVLLSGFLTLGAITPTDGLYRVLSSVAWAAAGLLGITSMSFFFIADTKRRAQGLYLVISWKQLMYYATVALLLIAVVWSAVEIGLWVGKLG